MNIDGGGLYFDAELNNDKINAAVDETMKRIAGLSDATVAGGKIIDETFQKTADDIKNTFAEIDKATSINKAELAKLEAEYKKLGESAGKAFMSGKDDDYRSFRDRQQVISSEIATRKQLLVELEKNADALSESEKKMEGIKEKADKAANSHVTFRTQLRNAREELIRMEQAGLRGTAAYNDLQQQVGQLQDAMDDATQQARVLANDEGAFQGVIAGLSGIAGGFSAVTGAVSLFAGENENLQKIMVKVQSLMAITIGLQQVQATLNKDSYFRLKVMIPVQNAYSGAIFNTGKAFIKMGASASTARIAAQALYGTLTLGLSVAIGGAIALWNKYSSEQEKAAEQMKKQLEIEKSANEIALKTRFELKNHIKDIERFTGTKEQEKKKVDELNQKYGEAMGYYKSLGEWYDVLQKKGEDYINMLFLQAKVQSLVTKAIEADEKVNEIKKTPSGKVEGSMGWFKKGLMYMAQSETQGNFDAQQAINEFNNDAKEKALKSAESIRDGYIDEAEKLQDEIYSLHKNGVGGFVSTVNNTTKTAIDNDPFKTLLDERRKQYDEYFKWVNAGYSKEAKTEFATLLQEGNTYREYLQQMLDSGKLTKEQIKQVMNEIVGETNKSMVDTFKESLTNQLQSAKTVIEQLKVIQQMRDELQDDDPLKSKKMEVLDESDKETEQKRKQETQKILDEYAGVNDQKLDLQTQFFNDIALLNKQREQSNSDAEKQRIDRTIAYRKKKYNEDVQNMLKAQTDAQIRLAELERDKSIQEISSRKYLWEADRKKDMLDAEKKALETTLTLLKKLQQEAPTDELAEEIERVTLEIEGMNNEIEVIPSEKFQEMLTGVQRITSALGGLDGEIGQMFSNISNQIENIKVAFDETATTTDKVSAGITGLVSIINMLTSSHEKRKQVEKEYYQNQIALAHEYALALNEILRTQSEMSGSRFIIDYSGRINDGFKAMTEATEKYQQAMSKLGAGKAVDGLKNSVDWGNVGAGVGAGAAVGAAVGAIGGPIIAAIGAGVGALVGGIVGLFGGKKKKETHEGLLDMFPELVDGAGNLNKELAQTLINTKQVDDNTKQLIQNALEWADAVEEARKQMSEVVVELAGNLGNGIKNALDDAFRNGKDASVGLFDEANKSLENFIDNLIYGLMFSKYFEEFKKNLDDAMMDDGILDENEIINAYDKLMQGVESGSQGYFDALEAIKKRAKERGFDLWKGEADKANTSLTGAVKGVTEDTASLVAGQMNAIRINQMEATVIMRQQLFFLANIDRNTGSIDENTRYIRLIYDKLETADPLRSQGIS